MNANPAGIQQRGALQRRTGATQAGNTGFRRRAAARQWKSMDTEHRQLHRSSERLRINGGRGDDTPADSGEVTSTGKLDRTRCGAANGRTSGCAKSPRLGLERMG
jgi:hypothetical protein